MSFHPQSGQFILTLWEYNLVGITWIVSKESDLGNLVVSPIKCYFNSDGFVNKLLSIT